MLEAGNATEHLNDKQEKMLESVIDMIRNKMYKSMEDAHKTDDDALKAAIKLIEECNWDIEARQSATGDLGRIHQQAIELQYEANRLQGIVDDRTHDNDTM